MSEANGTEDNKPDEQPAEASKQASHEAYETVAGSARWVAAPEVAYRPRRPAGYRPRIGLIGCGGITSHHLGVYRSAGYDVVALCDVNEERAQNRRNEFFPEAQVYTSSDALLARADVEVVDIATHPPERLPLIRAAIEAGKHVLSQKPFVLDLDEGQKLVDLADAKGVKLAVNQNGRWAPHVSWMRNAIAAGHVGTVTTADATVAWSHNWVAGSPFDTIQHLMLYDFAIHWFDMVHCYMPNLRPKRVYASALHSAQQVARPPLLAHAVIEFDGGQATLSFRGDTKVGSQDRTLIVGDKGLLLAAGADLGSQSLSLFTEAGEARPELVGKWFDDGFDGTMGELLCAIEEDREPTNSARDNLKSLELCFAALHSADTGQPVDVGSARKASPGAATGSVR
ncbi:MAG: Gfo/Idh/MocA family protein [Phycisphaerae bacterium]